jgi:hypothetical protein
MTSTFLDRYHVTVWCKSCGRKVLLMPEHLTKLAERIPFNIYRLDFFTMSKAAPLFRCSECNQKNSEFMIEPIAEEPSPQVNPPIKRSIQSYYEPIKKTPPPKKKGPTKKWTITPYGRRNPIHRGPGLCIRCGEPIPEGRLKAVPGTNLCTGCKRAEEI